MDHLKLDADENGDQVTVIYPTWQSYLMELKRHLLLLQANYSLDLNTERRQHLADDVQGIANCVDGLHEEAEALGLLDKEMFKGCSEDEKESNHCNSACLGLSSRMLG